MRVTFQISGPDIAPETEVKLAVHDRITIGRVDDNNALVLSYAQISRRHVELYVHNQEIYVRDLSMFGTQVNGKRLRSGETRLLKLGDQLSLGPCVLILIMIDPNITTPDSDSSWEIAPTILPPKTAIAPLDTSPNVGVPPPPPGHRAEPEHTGSMEPGDWDEAPAPAEAEPPKPQIMPSPAPGGLPNPMPRPQRIDPPKTMIDSLPLAPRRTVPPPMQSENEKSRRSRQQANPPQPVLFSAYYPREVKPDDWQPLQAYVFKESAADRVLEDAEKQLGPLDRFRRIVESARQIIREGDTITATPNLPGFQFNPPSVSVGFFEDWHRFDFKMRAKDAPLHLAANGLLTFAVNGIIVADIPLSVFVTNEVTNSQPQRTPPQPIYDTVFASYSHKDTAVVLKVEAAAKTFGMTYLRDVISLRSGEDWSTGLEKLIDDATIFQMFWSQPYSVSQHCKREWEYAIGLKKESPHFIRPVYWLQPMPAPPPPLQHLHFAYQPDLVK